MSSRHDSIVYFDMFLFCLINSVTASKVFSFAYIIPPSSSLWTLLPSGGSRKILLPVLKMCIKYENSTLFIAILRVSLNQASNKEVLFTPT